MTSVDVTRRMARTHVATSSGSKSLADVIEICVFNSAVKRCSTFFNIKIGGSIEVSQFVRVYNWTCQRFLLALNCGMADSVHAANLRPNQLDALVDSTLSRLHPRIHSMTPLSDDRATVRTFAYRSLRDIFADSGAGDVIEQSMGDAHATFSDYKSCVARVLANLRNPKSGLLEAVVSQRIVPSLLATMSCKELFPNAQTTTSSYSSHPHPTSFTPSRSFFAFSDCACRKCGGDDISSYDFQVRSADEPMTTFRKCLTCEATWSL